MSWLKSMFGRASPTVAQSPSATVSTGSSLVRDASGDEYVRLCLEPQYREEEEARTWQSDPRFRTVLDPLNGGDYDSATKAAAKLVSTFPDFHLVYMWQGSAQRQLGAFDRAREVLLQGLAKSKRKSILCEQMGRVEWNAGDLKQAVYWWAQAIHGQETPEGSSNDESAYLHLYYVADGMGLPDVAAAFISRVDQMRAGQIRLAPSTAADLRGLARRGTDPSIERVITGLRDKYLIG